MQGSEPKYDELRSRSWLLITLLLIPSDVDTLLAMMLEHLDRTVVAGIFLVV